MLKWDGKLTATDKAGLSVGIDIQFILKRKPQEILINELSRYIVFDEGTETNLNKALTISGEDRKGEIIRIDFKQSINNVNLLSFGEANKDLQPINDENQNILRFEGSLSDYEENRKKRLGDISPQRIKYRKLKKN